MVKGKVNVKELLIRKGNLWDFFDVGFKIVITTNIGWDRAGRNNMGAGVALEAWRRYPELANWYGNLCRRHAARTPVVEYEIPGKPGLLLFPVKPLTVADPEFSWNQRADLKLITRSAQQLAALARRQNYTRIALAFPGCGNGSLEQGQVLPILRKHLNGLRFVVVDREPKGRYPLGHGIPPA